MKITPLLLFTAALPLAAQHPLTCENNNNYRNQASHCEMQEQKLGSISKITVDGRTNGGISVKSWDSPGILVRARVEAYAPSEGEARALYSQVIVHSAGGVISADGPSSGNWSVSYEIQVPTRTDLNLKAHNGGISIDGVNGLLEFATQNGGVHLAHVAGDVHGRTQNGGVHVELAGARWDGRGMDVQSQNGGVNLIVPANFSAHLETSTVNGSLKTDFPNVPSDRHQREMKFDMGSGGAPIHVSTTNGGVHITHSGTSAI